MDDSTTSAITKNRTGALSARDQILALAHEHGINCRPNALDALGDAITRLAGDDVTLDETELLLLALERAGSLTTGDADRLHVAYMR